MYLFAKKIGMSRFLDKSGKFIPCTLFKPISETDDLVEFVGDFEYFDIQGKTIGKGFAGAMKRHGFGGLRATHGVSVSHRSHGSTGQCQDPGRVFKGKKMAGHMGCVTATTQNLRYLSTFEGALIFSGCTAGHERSIVRIRPAVKKHGKIIATKIDSKTDSKNRKNSDKKTDDKTVEASVTNIIDTITDKTEVTS